jgi:Flp pilus assembly protein TadG
MRRLNHLSHGHVERGASAILIALCAVILFGIAAWVIDGSALYQERAELQNGADAAALAIAADCVEGDCGAYNITAESYIDANAEDGDTALQANGVTFPTSNQVRVAVATADAGDDTDNDVDTVDYVFAQVFGKQGFQVLAEATAQWGTAGAGGSIPIIMSECEWDWATNDGTAYPEEPWNPSDERTILFHDPSGGGGGGGSVPDCDAHPGHDFDGDTRLPGGFGWLQSEDCETYVDPGGWVGSKPGNGAPNDCDFDGLLGTTVMIPVFDDLTESGGPGGCTIGPGGKCYHVLGFAGFHISGFRFPGNQSSPPPCNPPLTCISGYFTEFVFGNATGGGGTDLGARAVWLVS